MTDPMEVGESIEFIEIESYLWSHWLSNPNGVLETKPVNGVTRLFIRDEDGKMKLVKRVLLELSEEGEARGGKSQGI